MPHAVNPYDRKHDTFSFQRLWQPIGETFPGMPPLESRGDKPLELTFERELMSLVFYHFEEHTSGRHLLQVLDENKFARENIAPPDGVKKSTFFETINSRGLAQMAYVFRSLYARANKVLPKAKLHLGFDLNRGIPARIILTSGKAGEGQFVSQILDPGQTGSLDRAYHVILGSQKANQTEKPIRVVGYQICNVKYWVPTDRLELAAEQIALIYKLRWEIEKFFAWWKRHLKVYHIIARSAYGLMVQILVGLITYLLPAIYCRENHHEPVSIKRGRELRINIQNKSRYFADSVSNFFCSICARNIAYMQMPNRTLLVWSGNMSVCFMVPGRGLTV